MGSGLLITLLFLAGSAPAQDPTPPPPPPVAASLSALRIELSPDSPATALSLTAEVHVHADGYVDLPLGLSALVLSRATLDGRPLPLAPSTDLPQQRTLTAELSAGRYLLRAEGVLASPTPQAHLDLPPEVAAVIRLDAPGLDVEVEGSVPIGPREVVVLPGPARPLAVTWRPATPPPPRPRRLVVESAVGISVESGGIEGQAQLRYQALNGPVEEVSVRLGGPIEAIEASGPLVQGSERQGDVLVVRLKEPVEGDFRVDLSFRGPAPRGAVPLLLPLADRVEGWVSLHAAEEGYLEQTPQHLSPVPPDEVPAWGQGLAPGTLLATWRFDPGTSPGLSVTAQRWELVESPGTLIDQATVEVAHAAHGRTLSRARLMVRNDRRQYLGVRLPPGSTLLVARVAGNPVEVVRDGAQIRVPLEKSVETLTGLISFPVELSWLSTTPPWSRRGERTLAAPRFDVPVTLLRWSLYLPPEVEARSAEGRGARVLYREAPPRPPQAGLPPDDPFWSQFAGLDPARRPFRPWRAAPPLPPEEVVVVEDADVRAKKDMQQQASVELWNQAYSAYKDNDFEAADELLEQSLELDPDNTASQALLGNVEVLQGEGEASGAQAERIRAMARSRSGDAEEEQRRLLSEAEQLYRAGDMDRAVEQYNQAITVTDQLARLEDSNANLQKSSASRLRETLKKVEEERVSRQQNEVSAVATGSEVDDEEEVTIDFQSVEISGALMQPQGGLLFSEEIEPEPVPEMLAAPMPVEDLPVNAAPPATTTTISRDYLQRIPAGRSYQSSVQVAAGVTGTTRQDDAVGGAAGLEVGRLSLDLGRGVRDRAEDARGESVAVVEDVMVIPEGVTSSQWIMLVPDAGLEVVLERQLLGADEAPEVRLRYRTLPPAPEDPP